MERGDSNSKEAAADILTRCCVRGLPSAQEDDRVGDVSWDAAAGETRSL